MVPDDDTWKAAHRLVIQAFCDPVETKDKKRLEKLLKKNLPENLKVALFDYNSFLTNLMRMNLSKQPLKGQIEQLWTYLSLQTWRLTVDCMFSIHIWTTPALQTCLRDTWIKKPAFLELPSSRKAI